jgi:hypothetical protein
MSDDDDLCDLTGRKVYTLGMVNYDLREETPRGVFSSAERAKQACSADVQWVEVGSSWEGAGIHNDIWVIVEFVIDGQGA